MGEELESCFLQELLPHSPNIRSLILGSTGYGDNDSSSLLSIMQFTSLRNLYISFEQTDGMELTLATLDALQKSGIYPISVAFGLYSKTLVRALEHPVLHQADRLRVWPSMNCIIIYYPWLN